MLHSVIFSEGESTKAYGKQRGTMDEVRFDPDRLSRTMKAAKLGNTELAAKVGISRQMVYLLRKGKRPSVSAGIIAKLANATNTTVSYLMGGESDNDTPPIQKLPEGVRKLAEIANLLSEIRREELLRIAAALRQFEEEQTAKALTEKTTQESIDIDDADLDETERIAREADQWLDSIQRTRGKDVRDEIEKIFRDKNLFIDSTS